MLIEEINSSLLFDICVPLIRGLIGYYQASELTIWEVFRELNKIIYNFPAASRGFIELIGYEKISSEFDSTKIIYLHMSFINSKTLLNILKKWFGDRILQI
jgi:hypothetical protein